MGKKLKRQSVCWIFTALLILTLVLTPVAGRGGLQAATVYTLEAKLIDGDNMPGVYSVTAVPGQSIEAENTIGIPSVSKQTLANEASKELPAIIMGAAVNFEKKTGPTTYERIGEDTERIAPYSYFRWGVMDEQIKEKDGTTSTHKKLSGFDGSYYIIRVNVSEIIKNCGEGQYLHVKQENNKALMAAIGMDGTTFSDGLGNKTGAYSLANHFAALKDTGANDLDKDTPYFDVIVYSSGKLAAGADAGKQDAPSADIKLSFYVDDKVQYNELEPLPTTNPPTFPWTCPTNGKTYQLETDYTKDLLAKFYDDTAAQNADTANKASYLVKGSDLETDVAIDESEMTEGDATQKTDGINWMTKNADFWSMTKAIDHQQYDNHTIILICEVPVLEGLKISGTDKRSVILDVNSFDIQIANNSEKDTAGLEIDNNAQMRLMDSSNTSGAELAIGNNATMVIKKGGVMIIDESCTAEVEYDAATAVEQSQMDTSVLNGAIVVEDGGKLINYGVINVEGTEGKPQQEGQTVYYDKKSADITVKKGAILDNYGCVSLKGVMYMLGTFNNYGKYDDVITAYDPDKGNTSYHKGVQITWKDDVTAEGVEPGVLNIGIDADKNVDKSATFNNYGDVAIFPGTINLYGTFSNLTKDGYSGHLYTSTVKEAIIPITPDPNDPLTVEKTVVVDPPKKSVFNNQGTFDKGEGVVAKVTVELIHNGVPGKLTVLPTATLTQPVEKTLSYTGEAQELVTAGSTTEGKMYYALGENEEEAPEFDALSEAAEKKWTEVVPSVTKAGTYYVWYMVVGDDDHNDTEPVCIKTEIPFPVNHTVLFVVENGSWDDGTAGDKEVTVSGYEGDVLKLSETDIPAVGKKPSSGYQAGDWDVIPDAETVVTEDIVFTYTYEKKPDPVIPEPVDDKAEKDAEAAEKVTKMINALPEATDIKTSDKTAVEAARAAYEALTDDQKALISKDVLKKLTDDEKALKEAEDDTEKYSNEWVDGKWYDADGEQTYEPEAKWYKNSKGWWYEDESGWYPRKSWQKIDGELYFFDAQGYMEADAFRDGYYLTKSGARAEGKALGWKKDAKGWWYALTEEIWISGIWQKIDGRWYYFHEDGYAAQNEFIKGWWCNENCVQSYTYRSSWKKDAKGWWYGDATGWYAKGEFYLIDEVSYAFSAEGYCLNP